MFDKKYKQINDFLIIIVLGLVIFPLFATGNDDAIRLFKQKKYEEALPIFNALLHENPTDTSLSYYTGVCLTETNQYGNETIKLLLIAVSDKQPVDVYFYLGKNYHAMNNFKIAKSYYDLFDKRASKKEKKNLDLQNKIDLCNRYINPFPHFQPIPVSAIITLQKDSVEAIKVEERPLEIPSLLDEAIINFILTTEIRYTRFYQFRTYFGRLNFINGWKSADSLSSLFLVTDSLRNEYGRTSSSEARSQISNRVIDLESQILKTKSFSDESYFKANEFELSYWKQAPEDEKWKLIAENDSIKMAEEAKMIAEIAIEIPSDTIPEIDSIDADTIAIMAIEPIAEQPKTSPLVYKIQIGKFNTELPESSKKLFRKISALRTIDQYIDEKNFTVYTIGELTNLKDAVKLQEQIRQESVKDAFVIAIKDGKRISLNEAQELSKKQ
jgi:tetratricopeptide (TPR) repeat protein